MSRKMKAAFYQGPDNIGLKECDAPEAGPGELVIKVEACGICPSDVRMLKRLKRPTEELVGLAEMLKKIPGMGGHECAGKVVEIGEGVKGFEVGDDVVPDLSIRCGTCRFCRMGRANLCEKRIFSWYGGFAEYTKALARNTYKTPENATPEEVCFAEPLACVLNGNLRSKIKRGDDVAIVGAGPIGLMHLQLAKASGARVVVTDFIGERLGHAKELGADDIINPSREDATEKMKNLTEGKGADVVIVAVGNKKAIEQGIQMVAKEGLVNLFAGTYPVTSIEVDPNVIHYGEVTLTGSYDSDPWLFERAIKLIGLGIVKTKPLISHRLPLDEIAKGFKIVDSQSGLKVIIES